MSGVPPVNIFGFDDYRALLRALYAHKKANEYGFSHRAFSRRAGLKSTNFLKLVMDGERNLSPEAAQRFAAALGLSGTEAEYFCELVGYNQASNTRERARAYERLCRLKPERTFRELSQQQADYYANWYLPAIRELAARSDFCADPVWIARTLVPAISSAQARKALATLESLGLLVRASDGTLKRADAMVTTGFTPLGHHLAEYHRAMLARASESIDLHGCGAHALPGRGLQAVAPPIGQSRLYVSPSRTSRNARAVSAAAVVACDSAHDDRSSAAHPIAEIRELLVPFKGIGRNMGKSRIDDGCTASDGPLLLTGEQRLAHVPHQ